MEFFGARKDAGTQFLKSLRDFWVGIKIPPLFPYKGELTVALKGLANRQELEACPATSSFRFRSNSPGSFQFLWKLEVPDREE